MFRRHHRAPGLSVEQQPGGSHTSTRIQHPPGAFIGELWGFDPGPSRNKRRATETRSVDRFGGDRQGILWYSILEIYREYGITSAYSILGGNVVTLGAKPDGSPWQIGIQRPRQANNLLGAVSVADQTVVTSGDYQRFFTDSQGKKRHHILNPRSGYPAEAGLISVSIVSENSMAADALSTILFVAGLEKGRKLLRGFPQTEAIFVDTNLQVHVTRGLRYRFQAAEGIAVTILG